MDDTVENVTAALKQAREVPGVTGMKVVGEAVTGEPDKISESVAHCHSGVVDAITVGFTEQAQIEDMIGRIDLATRA